MTRIVLLLQLRGLTKLCSPCLSSPPCLEDFGKAHLEDVQTTLLDHARAWVGADRVQKICAILMQMYFGISHKTDLRHNSTKNILSDMMSTLQPHTAKEVKCCAERFTPDCHRIMTWCFCSLHSTSSNLPSLLLSKDLTFHALVSILWEYNGLFRQEMGLRGLMLISRPLQSTFGGVEHWTFSLVPESGVWIAHEEQPCTATS